MSCLTLRVVSKGRFARRGLEFGGGGGGGGGAKEESH